MTILIKNSPESLTEIMQAFSSNDVKINGLKLTTVNESLQKLEIDAKFHKSLLINCKCVIEIL